MRAIRDGRDCLIKNTDILVGDLLRIEQGDILQADGMLTEGELK